MTTTEARPAVDLAAPTPRVTPGTRSQIGTINWLIATVAGRVAGSSQPLRLFTTLARHRRLFRRWLIFAGALMPRGSLPRGDTELVILRVAHNCDCEYEWRHHERMGRRFGIDAERVRSGREADGWSPRQAALLRAVDELHEQRTLSDEGWRELRTHLNDVEAIELCMLAGHYEMLAMTLNALRVEPDRFDR
ncbi:MAG: carboxymuconolactone decarboxylase family protein [Thermoleophilaceae bacterium]|jgi:AhpD family alkylhydroperoxidase